MNKWILYTIVVGFAVYWASNLLLWFPWSYSTGLGITLMLTVSPILWAYSTFLCLISYPKNNQLIGALIISLILLIMATVMDYLFFGLIRNAMDQLYHPTTFYGYGFVISLPFIIALIFKSKIAQSKKLAAKQDFLKAGISGLLFFGILTLIIILGIEI